jgi:tetratricopeptide (TPR) repeat protein
MDLLKLTAVVFFVGTMMFQTGQAQQYERQKNAFSQSYALEAKEDFKGAAQAIRDVYDEGSYEINLRLGWLYYQAKEYPTAETYYRKAVALMPYGIEARFGLVLPLASMGNWTQVGKVYEEILSVDPNNSLANYRYGLIMYNKGDYLKSEKYVSKTVNLYPFDYDGVVLLGWIKLKLNKPLEAKVLFQKALLYKPGDASAMQGLGLIK